MTMEYMVSIQVLLENVSLVVLYKVCPEKPFPLGLAMEYMVSIQVLLKKVSLVVLYKVCPEKRFPLGLV